MKGGYGCKGVYIRGQGCIWGNEVLYMGDEGMDMGQVKGRSKGEN